MGIPRCAVAKENKRKSEGRAGDRAAFRPRLDAINRASRPWLSLASRSLSDPTGGLGASGSVRDHAALDPGSLRCTCQAIEMHELGRLLLLLCDRTYSGVSSQPTVMTAPARYG